MGFDVPGGPEGPEPGEGEDRVVVDDDDMEFVARSKRGRPRKLQEPETLQKLVQMYFVERMSMREVADNLGVSHMSVYRMLCDPAIELLI
jgi:DNA-directed RNA polymerase specialized sigma subunit